MDSGLIEKDLGITVDEMHDFEDESDARDKWINTTRRSSYIQFTIIPTC